MSRDWILHKINQRRTHLIIAATPSQKPEIATVSLKHGVAFPESANDMMPFDIEKTWKAMEGTVDAGSCA